MANLFRPPLVQQKWDTYKPSNFDPSNAIPLQAAVQPAPFVPIDFQIPGKYFFSPSWYSPNLLLTTLSAVSPPFIPVEFPLARRPAISSAYEFQNLLVGTLAATPVPFFQSNWPSPIRAAFVPAADYANVAPTLYTAPFFSRDYTASPSISAPTRWRSADQSQNLLTGTLALTAAAPFYMTDWPSPIGYVSTINLRSWSNQLNINLPVNVTVTVRNASRWRHRGRR